MPITLTGTSKRTTLIAPDFCTRSRPSQLLLLDFGGVTHLNANTHDTHNLDLVIANTHDSSLINLEILDETFESDHSSIEIIVSLFKFIFSMKSFRIRSKQTDWGDVANVFEERYLEFFDRSFVNFPASKKYDTFVTMVKDSIIENTPKRMTVDNIFNLTFCVQDGFISNKDTVAVFSDIKGTFDNVVPSILLQQLSDIGYSDLFLKFVDHLGTERYITNAINLDAPRKVTKGVPQGGVLSPLLFNIYVRNVADGIRSIAISGRFSFLLMC